MPPLRCAQELRMIVTSHSGKDEIKRFLECANCFMSSSYGDPLPLVDFRCTLLLTVSARWKGPEIRCAATKKDKIDDGLLRHGIQLETPLICAYHCICFSLLLSCYFDTRVQQVQHIIFAFCEKVGSGGARQIFFLGLSYFHISLSS